MVSVFALATACSGGDKVVAPGDDNNGGNVPVAGGALVAGDSLFLAQSTSGYIMQEFNSLRTMASTGVAPTVAPGGLPAGCVTTTGGADANRNNIPDDQTFTFGGNCTTVSNGVTITVSGSARIQDDGGILGYKFTLNNFKVTGTAKDTTVTVTLSGVQEVVFTDARNARTVNTTTSVIETKSKTGSVSLSFTKNLTGTFVGSSNFTPRGGVPAGTYSVTGNYTLAIALAGDTRTGGLPASVTFTVAVNTSRALTFDGFCSQEAAFNNGEISGQVSGFSTGALNVKYTTCGTGTTTPPTTKK
jgi:hypothetical protein